MNSPASTDYSGLSRSYSTADDITWSDTRSSRPTTPSLGADFYPNVSWEDRVTDETRPMRPRIYTMLPSPPSRTLRVPGESPRPPRGSGVSPSYKLSPDEILQLVTKVQQLPSGASSTVLAPLRDMFPFVRVDMLSAVASNTFEAEDLYRLDSNPARRKGRMFWTLYGKGISIHGTSLEDYPTLHVVINPLTTYFRILMASCKDDATLRQLADGSHQYISQLVAFETKYEWEAVLAYHFDFHRVRLREMARGDYSKWSDLDVKLHVQHLIGREKQPPVTHRDGSPMRYDQAAAGVALSPGSARQEEICELFNGGICRPQCRNGRVHKCLGCDSPEHPLVFCPSARVIHDGEPY